MTSNVQMSKENFQKLVLFLGAKGCLLTPRDEDPAHGIVTFPDAASGQAVLNFVGVEHANALLVPRSEWKRFGGVSEPDYAALVELLPGLQRVPGASGETELTEQEATTITGMGFAAKQGPWTVPPLPDHLVAGDGLLECLCESWRPEEEGRPAEKREFVDTTHLIRLDVAPGEHQRRRPLTQDEARLVRSVTRGPVNRRRLQQRFWRIGAERFNVAFESLLQQGILALRGRSVICQTTES